jgi:hypothetical protein
MGASELGRGEWQTFIREVELKFGDNVRMLVYSAGAGPNAMERAELYRLAESRSIRIAAIASSPLVLGMLKALSWSGKLEIAIYLPQNLASALNYLGLRSSDRQLVLQTFRDLVAEMGLVLTPAR